MNGLRSVFPSGHFLQMADGKLLQLKNVPVSFPYTPYPQQETLMTAVITSLQSVR